MNVIVFGATGQMGRQLIKQALWKGHIVKAFGRNIHELDTEDEKLQTIKGSVFDDNDIKKALKGCDAVVSALGGGVGDTDITRSLGIKKIIAGMKALKINRIIAIGGLGVLNAAEDKYIFENEDFPDQYKAITAEHFKAFEQLKNSGLDWTFMCPPDLVEAPYAGKYQVSKNYPPQGSFKINTGDLAEFMISELANNAFLQCRVGIAE
jgi:uncharacterized protein